MISRTVRTRTTLVALATAAILVPTALARPIPEPDDGASTEVVTNAGTTRPVKPTLEATKPGTRISQALYVAALAGTATTSR